MDDCREGMQDQDGVKNNWRMGRALNILVIILREREIEREGGGEELRQSVLG